MTLFRAIPINVHAALEVAAAPLLIVAPFALGFGYLAGAVSIALGVLLIGLATSVYGDSSSGEPAAERPRRIRLHTGRGDHRGRGRCRELPATYIATVFLVGFGFAHMALTASTRFSRPLGA